MNDTLRSRGGIIITLAIVVVIALALVTRGFIIGDTDDDADNAVPGSVISS